MKEFVVSESQSLKEFTDNTYPQGSLYFNRLLKEKEIKVNGAKVSSNVRVKRGDVVSYYLTKRQEEKELFTISYEDDEVLLVDKDSGVNAEAVFSTLQRAGECYFIHRLDRNTQGLIIFAKTKRAESVLLGAFRQRTVKKHYEALCFGSFPKAKDTLEAYLQKNEKEALVTVSKKPIGEKIVTEYEVLEKRGEMTRVKVILHTGKTHQIRAHLSFIGCPVVGDEKYGDNELNQKFALKRQCLISKELTFFSTPLKIDGMTFRSHFDFSDKPF